LQAVAGEVDKFLLPGEGMAVCYKNKQYFSGSKRRPDQDVADNTGVCLFIVDGNAEFLYNPAGRDGSKMIGRMLNTA